MSPVLKEAVPVGSLECRIVKSAPASVSEKRKLDMTRLGWKMESFTSAAGKVSAAGSRLQEEAERESRYWEQISSLKARGWAISRLPQDSRSVGVHFGFAEAAPAFRNRGFAILRRGQDGNLRLDRGAILPRPLVVTVTVSMDGQECGSSGLQHDLITDNSPIEDQILQAYRALSEEELFHEISREGRLLANQGVYITSQSIMFDFGDKFSAQIRLVDPQVESPSIKSNASADEIAKAIALSLHVLLTHAHQQNHHRRSTAPSPIILKAKARSEYALLRPIMSHLQHISHLDFLRSLTASVLPPLSKSGIYVPAKFRPLINWNMPASWQASSLQANNLLEPLIAPLESTMTLELPTKRTLELTIRTFVGQPVFGTEFNIRPLTYGNKHLISPRLETVADVEKFVCRVFMVDLATFIEELHNKSRNGGKTDGIGESGTKLLAQPWWSVTDLHHGELSLQKLPDSVEKLQVRVWRDRLGLRHVSNIVPKKSAEVVLYIWEADSSWRTTTSGGQEDTSGLHLSEVLKQTVPGKISDS